jgi:hypothetical protein
MQIRKVPDPLGPIAQDHFVLGSTPAAIPSFGEEAFAKFLDAFDGAGVGRRFGIADGIALFVPGGLGERASLMHCSALGM